MPIYGTMGDDILHGTNKDDEILSGSGDDIVYGRGGDDRIVTDDAFMYSDDVAYGGRGNDTLLIGKGADVANGGKGDDTIVLTTQGPHEPYTIPDGTDTVVFELGGHGNGFGHDTVQYVQQQDVLVFEDKTGRIDRLEDLAENTRLVDVGENAYRLEWLKGDQSVTLQLDNSDINWFNPNPVDWDNFTSVEELAQAINIQFDYDFA